MSGEDHPDLIVQPVPAELTHLVSLFMELGEFSYQNLHAYQQVTDIKLQCYEIETLKAIQNAKREGLTYGSD